jgi:hypothetical protein
MIPRKRHNGLLALLLAGSASPIVAAAHSEGVEAADPATPPAVLSFDGAAARYTKLAVVRREWRAQSASPPAMDHAMHTDTAVGTDMHADHGSTEHHTPATTQQQ